MTIIIPFAILAIALALSYLAGKYTSILMDRSSQGYVDPNSMHFMGKFAGVFLGTMTWGILVSLAGETGLWLSLLLSPLAFPMLALVIVLYVRISESLSR